MVTPQQNADIVLAHWQALRSLPPEERIEILMREFFDPPIMLDCEYEMTIREVTECMRHG